jgi:hypothetical protein
MGKGFILVAVIWGKKFFLVAFGEGMCMLETGTPSGRREWA